MKAEADNMSRSSRGDDPASNKVRHRLINRHGLRAGKNAALPEDEGLDDRARKGLAKENGKAFGIPHAHGAIRSRVKGDLLGKKDT
jgi:hypothetical protein